MLIFELIGSPVVFFLMKINTWLPILTGLSMYIPILLCALCLPETLGVDQPERKPAWLQSTGSNMGGSQQQYGLETEQQAHQQFSWMRKSWVGLLQRWSPASLVIRDNSAVFLLLFTFLTTVLGNAAHETLLQFARRRFGWSWSQVSSLERSSLLKVVQSWAIIAERHIIHLNALLPLILTKLEIQLT